MSNWRINLGLGPVRYTRPIGGNKPASGQEPKKKSALGVVIAIVVTLGLMYLCCWGGVALMSRDIQ